MQQKLPPLPNHSVHGEDTGMVRTMACVAGRQAGLPGMVWCAYPVALLRHLGCHYVHAGPDVVPGRVITHLCSKHESSTSQAQVVAGRPTAGVSVSQTN